MEVGKMEYLTTTEMSEKWHISSRRVATLCENSRIKGAMKKGKTWLIPDNAEKPKDARKRTCVRNKPMV